MIGAAGLLSVCCPSVCPAIRWPQFTVDFDKTFHRHFFAKFDNQVCQLSKSDDVFFCFAQFLLPRRMNFGLEGPNAAVPRPDGPIVAVNSSNDALDDDVTSELDMGRLVPQFCTII